MRKCDNCYNGHYNFSERGEELYCDINEYLLELVDPENCCESHRYIEGYSDEEYKLFYDTSEGPGYFVVHEIDGKIDKYFKIFIANQMGIPHFCFKAFSTNLTELSNKIEFSFRDREDSESGLYSIMNRFLTDLEGEVVMSIDSLKDGNNKISLKSYDSVVKLVIERDSKKNHETIDINIGDRYACLQYPAISKFYYNLASCCLKEKDEEELAKIKQLKRI